MSHFTAAKLALRVGLGFAFLMLVILIIGIVMGLNINKTYQEMSEQIHQSSQADKTVRNLRIDIGQLRRFEKDYFLQLDNPQLKIQNSGLWHQAFNKASSKLKNLQPLLPAQHQARLQQSQRVLMNYKYGFEQVRLIIKQENILSPSEANNQFVIYKHFIYQLDESMVDLAQLTEQHEFALIEHLDTLRISRLWHLAISILLTLSICGVLVYFITRYSFNISKELEFRSDHDPLTGLLNRRGFEKEIQQLSKQQGALLYLDLDQFKLVNDLCGHAIGDELLTLLSHRFDHELPKSALIARLGGDEFGIFLPEFNLEAAHQQGQQLLTLIQNYPFSSQGRLFALNGSIGISIWDEKIHYKELVARADTACYIAKERGTGQIAHSIDVDNQHEQLQLNMNWAAKIPLMLQQDRFVLFYQKMENLQNPSAATGHAEILIRGIDEDGKIVPPGFFLPAAERFHLINRIDRWVAQSLLQRQLPENTLFAINLSGPSLADHAFLHTLVEWVKASNLPASQICFEITETAAMTDMNSAKLFISTLKALGCRFALDDFGSGFSSFSYLKDLDVDYLKIDGSMIRNLERNESDVALVTAIIQMAKALKLRTIAEFVENEIQREILRTLGVDYAQGYAIHKPEALPQIV